MPIQPPQHHLSKQQHKFLSGYLLKSKNFRSKIKKTQTWVYGYARFYRKETKKGNREKNTVYVCMYEYAVFTKYGTVYLV
jgi:hypothetical protein